MFKFEDQLNKSIENNASNIFVQYKEDTILYSDLPKYMDLVRFQLPPLSGKRILIILPDNLITILVHMECFRQGGVLIPLSPFAAQAQIDFICKKTNPHIIVTNKIIYAKNINIVGQYPNILIGNKLKDVSLFDKINFDFHKNKLNIVNSNYGQTHSIFFTSGTTGTPKGVVLSANNIMSAASINTHILKLEKTRKSIVTVPLYDYYGMIQIYSHLMTGARFSVGESALFPESAFKIMSDSAFSDVVLVPYTLRKLLDFGETNKGHNAITAWQHLNFIASSSDILSNETLERAFFQNKNLTIINVYGLTEAGRATYREIKAESEPSFSIGRASPGMQVTIDIDREDNKIGEIVIKGPTVMQGYLTGIHEDIIHYDPVNEIRTGDTGYYAANGEIILLGRKDHMLNLHGMKLHPNEIEKAVIELPKVNDALAWVSKNENGEPVIILDIVSDYEDISSEEIRLTLKDKIPRVFIPTKIRYVKEIKRTELGGKAIRPIDKENNCGH